MHGDPQVDYYAIGMTALPYTVYDWMSMDNMRNAVNDEGMEQDIDGEDNINFDSLDLDSLGLEGMQQFNMGDQEEEGMPEDMDSESD